MLCAQRLNLILFVADAVEHRSRTHHQQAAQVAVAGFGDASQPRLAAAAVLAGHQADPRRHLASVIEVVAAADAGQHARWR